MSRFNQILANCIEPQEPESEQDQETVQDRREMADGIQLSQTPAGLAWMGQLHPDRTCHGMNRCYPRL